MPVLLRLRIPGSTYEQFLASSATELMANLLDAAARLNRHWSHTLRRLSKPTVLLEVFISPRAKHPAWVGLLDWQSIHPDPLDVQHIEALGELADEHAGEWLKEACRIGLPEGEKL